MKPKKKCCMNCEQLGIEEGDLYFCELGSQYVPNEFTPDEVLNLYPLTREQAETLSCDENYKERKELSDEQCL